MSGCLRFALLRARLPTPFLLATLKPSAWASLRRNPSPHLWWGSGWRGATSLPLGDGRPPSAGLPGLAPSGEGARPPRLRRGWSASGCGQSLTLLPLPLARRAVAPPLAGLSGGGRNSPQTSLPPAASKRKHRPRAAFLLDPKHTRNPMHSCQEPAHHGQTCLLLHSSSQRGALQVCVLILAFPHATCIPFLRPQSLPRQLVYLL